MCSTLMPVALFQTCVAENGFCMQGDAFRCCEGLQCQNYACKKQASVRLFSSAHLSDHTQYARLFSSAHLSDHTQYARLLCGTIITAWS